MLLTYTALFMSTILMLLPEGGLKKIAIGITSASIMILLLKTVKYADIPSFSFKKDTWKETIEKDIQQCEEDLETKLIEEIEKNAEEMADNKANEIGLSCRSEVHLETSNYGDIRIKEITLTYEQKPEEDKMNSFAYWIMANFDVNIASQKHIWN